MENKLSLNETLSGYGLTFKTIFTILAIILLAELLATLIVSIIYFNLALLLGALILGSLFILNCYKNNINTILGFIFFMPLVGVFTSGLFAFLQTMYFISSTTIYIFIVIHALVFGILSAFMYSKSIDTFKKYVLTSFLFSVTFSIFSVINVVLMDILTKIQVVFAELGDLSDGSVAAGSSLMEIFNTKDLFNPHLGFVITLVLFILPYFFFSKKYENKELNWWLLHLISIAIYLLLSFGLVALANATIAAPLAN